MGEVCRLVQTPPHTLRYWERSVGLLRPARRSSGNRRYSRQDVETILLIKELIERRRMTAAGARRLILERRRGGAQPEAAAAPGAVSPATLKLLREIKKELQALVSELSKS